MRLALLFDRCRPAAGPGCAGARGERRGRGRRQLRRAGPGDRRALQGPHRPHADAEHRVFGPVLRPDRQRRAVRGLPLRGPGTARTGRGRRPGRRRQPVHLCRRPAGAVQPHPRTGGRARRGAEVGPLPEAGHRRSQGRALRRSPPSRPCGGLGSRRRCGPSWFGAPRSPRPTSSSRPGAAELGFRGPVPGRGRQGRLALDRAGGGPHAHRPAGGPAEGRSDKPWPRRPSWPS